MRYILLTYGEEPTGEPSPVETDAIMKAWFCSGLELLDGLVAAGDLERCHLFHSARGQFLARLVPMAGVDHARPRSDEIVLVYEGRRRGAGRDGTPSLARMLLTRRATVVEIGRTRRNCGNS